METSSDYGAFMERFLLPPTSSPPQPLLPLSSLTFAVKDIFDVKGYVTGFGNPDWLRTHPVATSTAPTVLTLLNAGATCLGKTVMDEMAYSINGENIHYGTPTNPCAADRVPGGSSSGSAVAVGAKLVDFSLEDGVIPMAQSFDTVGWFARDPKTFTSVGRVLLQLTEVAPVKPTRIIIAEDCFQLSSTPYDLITQVVIKAVEKLYGGDVLKKENLGDYVKDNVRSLNHFMTKENTDQVYNIPSLAALSSSMRLLQRFEFKSNHGEWISAVKPNLGPGISERVSEALRATGEDADICHAIRRELRDALTSLLGDFGVLMIPTVPGAPPKLQTDPSELEVFRARAFSLLSIAGVSGFCQVTIPLGMHNNLPISVSLLAKHGADGFLLHLVENLYDSIKQEKAAGMANPKS
ncbi:Amidase 1 [Stylosanthes scabra]|uniref:Amidase 1 n=1 Tax=Stylosanthes scabra TaxID=79078 RepID=A0ABU6YFU0_9FABA|nr:Amidase 1 [Stylosanthes scabra]